jgi:trypsin-like peptidase
MLNDDKGLPMSPLITEDSATEGWTGLVAIFTRKLGESPRFIGTGFWITNDGVFVTARHVIEDNIGEDGKDIASIAAFQWYNSPNGMKIISRPLKVTARHHIFDLAVCTTLRPEIDGRLLVSNVQPMTLVVPAVGSRISTHSFHDPFADTTIEKRAPIFNLKLRFSGAFEGDPGLEVTLDFAARWTEGCITEHLFGGRDKVMLPGSCVQSDIPVYAGMSGGPVFDDRGRVFAVNCTSFAGSDIAYHVPIGGILALKVNGFLGDDSPRDWTVRELERHKIVEFDPPIPEALEPGPNSLVIQDPGSEDILK